MTCPIYPPSGICRYANPRRTENPAEFDDRWDKIRRGWCLGDPDFRKEMGKRVDERISGYDRRSYLGEEARTHDEAEALRLLQQGLIHLNLDKADLPNLKKGDLRKKVIAALIRQNTGVRNDWICNQLSMGNASNLSRHVSEVLGSEQPDLIALREMTKKAF